LELYTEIVMKYPRQILGIFIRDVTTPVLSSSSESIASASTSFLPSLVEGSVKPKRTRSIGKRPGISFHAKSAENLPRLSTLQKDEILEPQFRKLSLKDPDSLAPLQGTDTTDQGITGDPLRKSTTPPPILSRKPLSGPSSLTVTFQESEKLSQDVSPLRNQVNTAEDPSIRVKRVENWRKRLSRARVQLTDYEIEIWTWRVGSDVEAICKTLIEKYMERKGSGQESQEIRAYI
jgi:hypothetical protein